MVGNENGYEVEAQRTSRDDVKPRIDLTVKNEKSMWSLWKGVSNEQLVNLPLGILSDFLKLQMKQVHTNLLKSVDRRVGRSVRSCR